MNEMRKEMKTDFILLWIRNKICFYCTQFLILRQFDTKDTE